MAQILKIMIEHGLKDKDSNLRNVCVPLITPAYPTKSTPYLPEDSLVILSGEMDEKCADEILKKLPEVKGVLKDISRILWALKILHLLQTLMKCCRVVMLDVILYIHHGMLYAFTNIRAKYILNFQNHCPQK
jgi:hypothetical protein